MQFNYSLTNRSGIILFYSRFTITITIIIRSCCRCGCGSCPRCRRRPVVVVGTGALLESVYKCLYNELDGHFINSLHVLRIAIS